MLGARCGAVQPIKNRRMLFVMAIANKSININPYTDLLMAAKFITNIFMLWNKHVIR
ncbi:hypothetical protein AE1304_41450 [Aeromonas enteropelogenes]